MRENGSQFRPGILLRNAHVQSLLASVQPRTSIVRRQTRDVERSTVSHILDCGDDVRLEGLYSAARAAPARGLVVVLHGWEGSARSSYMSSLTHQLVGSGFDVVRLNYRDHGDTHHLNEGLFHSCRLDEVVGAIAAVTRRFTARPLFLVGYSLGGNFALRVALRAPDAGLPLERVVAVSPAIDPAQVLVTLEQGPRMYERYFMYKWRRSLKLKQACFPDRYDFSDWMRIEGMREATRQLVVQYGFPTLEAYFQGYSVSGSVLAGLKVPTRIVTSADDPVCPISDIRELTVPPSLTVEIQPHGGHCGFIRGARLRSWIDERMPALLLDGHDN